MFRIKSNLRKTGRQTSNSVIKMTGARIFMVIFVAAILTISLDSRHVDFQTRDLLFIYLRARYHRLPVLFHREHNTERTEYISQCFSWITDSIASTFLRSWLVQGLIWSTASCSAVDRCRMIERFARFDRWFHSGPSGNLTKTPGSLKRRATQDPGSRYISKSRSLVFYRSARRSRTPSGDIEISTRRGQRLELLVQEPTEKKLEKLRTNLWNRLERIE